ncbi:hypothetical protein RSAG8_00959, partial [Rhizoctonia solani AG-8 WAC10335]
MPRCTRFNLRHLRIKLVNTMDGIFVMIQCAVKGGLITALK